MSELLSVRTVLHEARTASIDLRSSDEAKRKASAELFGFIVYCQEHLATTGLEQKFAKEHQDELEMFHQAYLLLRTKQ